MSNQRSTTTTMANVFSEEEAENAPGGNVVGALLARLADERPDVVVVSADMGSALAQLRERHPDRYIDLGIAETNTISVAAGLAASGFVPYVLSMAPFAALKTAEQIRTDLASTMMPVRIIARLSGLAMGFFGTSHHAVEDIAIARSITNLTVVAPCDRNSLVGLIQQTLDVGGPVLVRVSEGITRQVYDRIPQIARGRFVRVRDGGDATLIATGMCVGASLDAAELLAEEGLSIGVLDAAYLKPLDEAAIVTVADAGPVLVVEEHNVVGGLGTAVAEVVARHGITTRLGLFGLPDEDLAVALPHVLLEHYGLTAKGIADQLHKLVA